MHSWKKEIGSAIAVVLGSVAIARAGVVILQQTTTPDSDGKSTTETHTTTIDGGRLKSVTPEVTTIMDVDKGTMVLIRSDAKTWSEMPLSKYERFMATGLTGEFKATGKKRTIAGYSCEEYAHELKGIGEGSSLTCVSKDAPGAAEASAFYKRIAEKVGGKDTKGRPDGVVLAEEATMKPVMPEVAGIPPETLKKLKDEMAKRPPLVTKVLVTSIKSEKIATDAFEVPKGYKREPMPFTQKPATIQPVGKPLK